MSEIKFVLNTEGVRELMKSAEMMAIVSEKANNALASLGAGYEVTTYNGLNRCNAEIAAVTYEAKKENAKSNTILKAVRG